jgi:hypothetical protein
MHWIKTLITKWTFLPVQETQKIGTYDDWLYRCANGVVARISQRHKRRETASVFFMQRSCGVFFLKLYE